ncbi:MAG TPA: P-loop NTPase [Spirochaetia bacterium]|nr:P-loop NTPase [Spirochaetia bacterium]
MVIIPIASGKGGVGKSLLAVNLSIALAEAGRRVVLVDLDLGASNAHTMLGLRGVSRGIGTFLSAPRASFQDIVQRTEYDGLWFVAGDAEMPGTAALAPAQKRRLVRNLESLDFDLMVLDLGPGAGPNPLDFFLMGTAGIVVSTPALTSLLNAYLFLKNVVFRALYATLPARSPALAVLERMRRDRDAGLARATVPRILSDIAKEDPVNHALAVQSLGRLKPRLVLNLVEDPAEAEKMEKLRGSVREYLGIDCSQLGVMFRDELQAVALGSRVPILRYKPGCVLSRELYRVAQKLLAAAEEGGAPWMEGVRAQEAGAVAGNGAGSAGDPAAEAQEDYKAMRRDLEDLLATGTLSMADLVESVRAQQIELAALRKENALLRARLGRPEREPTRS